MPGRRWLFLDAFSNTFRDLRNRSSTTLFTAGLLALPVLLAGAAEAAGLPGLRLLLRLAGSFTVTVWLTRALTIATRQYALGSDPGVSGLLGLSSQPRRMLSLLGTQIIVTLILVAAAALALLPAAGVFVAAAAGADGRLPRIEEALRGPLGALLLIALLLGVLAFVVVAVLVRLRYGVAKAANVLESLPPTRSLARSRDLMRGHYLDLLVLGLLILAVLAAAAVVLLGPALVITVAALPETAAGMLPRGPLGLGVSPALSPAAALVVGLSFYLYQAVAQALTAQAEANFYLGLRGEEALRAQTASPARPGPGQAAPGGEHQADAGEQQHGSGKEERAGHLPERPGGDQG